MAAPTLIDYQFWFGVGTDSGKLFGINTEIDVPSVEGLEALAVRSGTRDFPRDDGAIPGLHIANRKTVIFSLEAIGDSEHQSLLDKMGINRIAEGELHWKYPDQTQKFVRARVFSRTNRIDAFTVGRIPLLVAFEVADPRVYDTVLEDETINIHSPAPEGIDFEIDFGVDFALFGGGGFDVVATNDGNARAYPLVRFFGPVSGTCTAVKLLNRTTGTDLELSTTILTGQTLTADMDARQRGTGTRIIDLAGASRYGDWVLPRDTFFLQPGDNVLRLEITGTSTDVFAVVNWRDTYL